MFAGYVEAGQAGHQQTVLAPHPLQQPAPALLPQEDGAAGSPGWESVAAAGPPCAPRAPGTVQVAEAERETVTSLIITSSSSQSVCQVKTQRLGGHLNIF